LVATSAALALSILLTYKWYLNPSTDANISYQNRLSDLNRYETIKCWVTSTSEAPRNFIFGQGFGKVAEEQCGIEVIPSLKTMGKTKGLPHAHNLYAQIFAETGIGGLTIVLFLSLAGFRKAWLNSRSNTLAFSPPLIAYLFLMALGITYWQVLMLNQILVGYSLASLSAVESDGAPEDAPTPTARAL